MMYSYHSYKACRAQWRPFARGPASDRSCRPQQAAVAAAAKNSFERNFPFYFFFFRKKEKKKKKKGKVNDECVVVVD
jgi:hypothetical protein